MESMEQENSKAALARVVLSRLPQVAVAGLAPGMAAILRSAVVAAGLDPLEVLVWVEAAGGHQAHAYLRPKDDFAGARNVRAPLHPQSYFAVPAHALATSSQAA